MSVIDIDKGLGISNENVQQINTDGFNKFAGSIILLQGAVNKINDELASIQKAINAVDKNLEGVNKNITAVINNNFDAIKTDLKSNQKGVAYEFQKLTVTVNALPVNVRNQICADLDKAIAVLGQIKTTNDETYSMLEQILAEYQNMPYVFDNEQNKLNALFKKYLAEQNNASKAQAEAIQNAAHKYKHSGTQLGLYLVIAVVFVTFVYWNDKFIPAGTFFSGPLGLFLSVLAVIVMCTVAHR